MLADLFENFKNEHEPAHYVSEICLAWQACLRKTGVKSELLTKNDILMMVDKGIRGGMRHGIHRYAKASNKYREKFNKLLNHHT